MPLTGLGWSPFFAGHFEEYRSQGYQAMRITRVNRENYVASNGADDFFCEVTGKFGFQSGGRGDFPTVGDWVVVSRLPNEAKAMIHALLPRRSAFRRKVAGQVSEEQVLAANIDVVFLVTGLDENFNLRRIERYLSLAWESGAVPVVLLNKADLRPDAEAVKKEVEAMAAGAEVLLVNARQAGGVEGLRSHLQPGRTVAFIGSSGVGKSTMINALLGTSRLEVNEVSDLGSRGRHTTTFRELIALPTGGLVIDTPGMRELQMWGDETGLALAFDDIEALAGRCRFKDCSHGKEPGCAVQAALAGGTLDGGRMAGYLKLKREFAYQSDRQTMKASAVEKSRWKDISKYARQLKKGRP